MDENPMIQMVDVSGKEVTRRYARAIAIIRMDKETIRKIKEKRIPKGDPIAAAEIAGYLAVKKTPDLIPLCHPIPISGAHIKCQINDEEQTVKITVEVSCEAKTGAEMEALLGAAIAALTIYDMCKGLDPAMIISEIRLEEKFGGRSGHWVHPRSEKSPAPKPPLS
ncbi:MAG: cyclic pyranopterin monophosphate synthase MoaC [Armatimonadetes bacterium]|nr:cyclic pyranopterin monophosphate synthase MoaC [Armatimonadota bacterium]MDW8122233.1 cyclic pyranopterin monophosphate synthase MoaC [Armatimonadota bacterium]